MKIKYQIIAAAEKKEDEIIIDEFYSDHDILDQYDDDSCPVMASNWFLREVE